MKRSSAAVAILLLTVLGALAGAGLRIYQRTVCMTDTGLIVPGSRILYAMLGFSVVGIAVIALFCRFLDRAPGDERVIAPTPLFLFFYLATF